MKFKNCAKCGTLYTFNGLPICSSCSRRKQDDIKRIREYLAKYPNSNVWDVEKGLGIEVDVILSYLREGKLEVSGAPNFFYACESCGDPTQRGRYCESCKKELATSLTKAASTSKTPETRHVGYYSK